MVARSFLLFAWGSLVTVVVIFLENIPLQKLD